MSIIQSLIEEGNETLYGSWQVFAVPPDHGQPKVKGRFYLTDQHIYFIANSHAGKTTGYFSSLYNHRNGAGYLKISRHEIVSISEQPSLLNKRVALKLTNGWECIFETTIFSFGSLSRAIGQHEGLNISPA